MEVTIIGLGKMGLNIAKNMKRNGITVYGTDVSPEARQAAEKAGIPVFETVADAVAAQKNDQKVVWSMLPAGTITDDMITELSQMLKPEDIVIDGGNSRYTDSLRHHELLHDKGIYFFDAGTSGGMNGALNGANYMVGGDEEAWPVIEEVFAKTAAPDGYLFTGKPGSGHFLKMIHNGIEYGMMQAIGEGFDVLEHSDYDYDYAKVAKLWNNGSVVRSWLMELAQEAFEKDADLHEIKGVMHSNGEGQWTVEEAFKLKTPVPVISLSVMMRDRSLENDTFSGKVVASLRNGFGGHAVEKEDK